MTIPIKSKACSQHICLLQNLFFKAENDRPPTVAAAVKKTSKITKLFVVVNFNNLKNIKQILKYFTRYWTLILCKNVKCLKLFKWTEQVPGSSNITGSNNIASTVSVLLSE